jgi:hypothetical protein
MNIEIPHRWFKLNDMDIVKKGDKLWNVPQNQWVPVWQNLIGMNVSDTDDDEIFIRKNC